jgi:DNA replication and repair protein RecF
VEQDFLKNSRSYLYALVQRNRLLKSRFHSSQLVFWNEELARTGEEVHSSRLRCIQALNSTFAAGVAINEELGRIRLNYRQGWKEGIPLIESFRQNQQQEISSGLTMSGPHKAEIEIQVGGGGVARIASRGQIKALVICIIAALVNYIFSVIGFRPIVLVDDFAAELDDFMRSLTLKMLGDSKAQVFLTSIDNHLANSTSLDILSTFHVEHGNVIAVH